MELYQLRTFLTVAEEGHLTRAAEKLFTSQPAVSTHIRALEEELGVKLFDRSAKGMTLTAQGTSLREHARRIVEATRNFKLQAESLRHEVSGELIFGLNNTPDILRLIPILRLLTDRHQALTYEMVCGSSGVILQGIDEGTISIGFFEGACNNNKIAFHALTQIDLCLVAPAAWEKELTNPDWKALEQKPWIFVSPLCSYFRTIEHICQEQGLELQARFRANEDITALNLVAEGLGVTVTSRSQIATFPQRDKLFVLPHFRASVPLCLGYLATRAEDPTIRAVRDAVLEVWADAPRPAAPAGISVTLDAAPAEHSPRRGRSITPRRSRT
jgi:DNA-binding transcriptional LysR family regulator